MSHKFKLTVALSVALLIPVNLVFGMDHPVKGESGYNLGRRTINPPVTIDRIREVFNDNKKKINISPKYTHNCVPCSISLYNWVNNQTEYPNRIGNRIGTNNIDCNKDFAELVKEVDNEEIGSRVVRINIEDGSVTPLNATFDKITMEPEDKEYKTLEDYMEEVLLKPTLDRSTRFRVGLLYLVYKNHENAGHMVCFYKSINNSIMNTYIIDPQLGIIKPISEFTKSFQAEFKNHGYIWFNKGENTTDFEVRNNYVKLDDAPAEECQARMDIDENGGLGDDEDEMEEDRTLKKRPREENSNINESPKKRQKVKMEMGSQIVEEGMEVDREPPKRPRKVNLALNKTVAVKQEINLIDDESEDRSSLKRSRKGNFNSIKSTIKRQKIKEKDALSEEEKKARNREIRRVRAAEKYAELVATETPEEREIRLKAIRDDRKKMTPNQRERDRERRRVENLTEKQRERKKQLSRDYQQNLNKEQKKHRTEYSRNWEVNNRAEETPEEREIRLGKYHKKVEEETLEEREIRLERDRKNKVNWLANKETPEQKRTRLEKGRNNWVNKLAKETPEETKIRLEKDRKRMAAKRSKETPEKRKIRLEKERRIYAEKKEKKTSVKGKA